MLPSDFLQANCTIHAPPDTPQGAILPVQAFRGEITDGDLDGMPVVVTCWEPSDEDRVAIAGGAKVYALFCVSQLPPHSLSVKFPFAQP